MVEKTPIIVVDRETGERFEEAILGEKWIRWAYQDSRSRLLERILFRSSVISKMMGRWYDSSFSRRKIDAVIQELSINVDEFARSQESFRSFNDFFARKLKPESRPYSDDPDVIVSPADGRVLVFPVLEKDIFVPVKGHPFSIQRMIPNHYKQFENGSLAVIRLCPADYHRYHFPCDGTVIDSGSISGEFHSVNPIALEKAPDVFGSNKRSYTIIETKNCGSLCYMEVGAFGVGSIINTCTSGPVRKMDEKGYFKFGGSTIILIFEPESIEFSEDLMKNSAEGVETLIKVGQRLAGVKHP